MNRLQGCAVERLSLDHDGERLAIREGFADHHVDVTLPSGRCWTVSEEGVPHRTHPNHSIDWSR